MRANLYYLYDASDASHCCALALERGLFRSREIVAAAGQLNCYMMSRSGEGRELLERYGIADRPAILLTDPTGAELGRLDDHIEHPRQLGELLDRALVMNARRHRATAKVRRDLARAASYRDNGNVPMALRLLRSCEKSRESLFEAERRALDAEHERLREHADGLLAEAFEAYERRDYPEAHRRLVRVRETCRGLQASEQAAVAVQRLLADPEAKQAIHDARSERRERAGQ